jgi:hypothetical protein
MLHPNLYSNLALKGAERQLFGRLTTKVTAHLEQVIAFGIEQAMPTRDHQFSGVLPGASTRRMSCSVDVQPHHSAGAADTCGRKACHPRRRRPGRACPAAH